MQIIKNNKEKVILAILTFLLSWIVYMDTLAPTVSFWDCGEFIATSYTLGVPHPPGSPLYLLIGRFFAMLPIGNDIAYRVNLISPIASSFSVMFLFLIIVQMLKSWGRPVKPLQKIAVYGGAFIGAMTFAFTDSHWFNAVEAEVYAFSTFLTAIVVWLILFWEQRSDKPEHERYLLLIAYIIGLAIGIHLLNLLAIFFIALIIYFKRTKISSIGWLIADIIIGVAGISLIFLFWRAIVGSSFSAQSVLTVGSFLGIYLYLYYSTKSERYKEHSKNVLMATTASAAFLVIYGGVIRGIPKIADSFGVGMVVVTILIIFLATAWVIRKKHYIASLVLMSLVLIIVGYSSYTTIFIRSSQNPTIDENDPETTHQAVAYMEREQYGRREFTDVFNRAKWKPETKHLYKNSLDFFWNYQIKKMYIRYFNWQFIGRKGANVDPFQFLLPFPFLVGLYGLLVHFNKDKKKALSLAAFFLFTGLMIVLYLNQDDPQPRERDYSYVGSFFAFSVWIGIGASALIGHLTELKNKNLRKPLTYLVTIVLLIALPINVLTANYHEHSRKGNYVASDYAYNLLQSCEPNGIIFTNGDNDTFPLWYAQEVENVRKDVRVVNLSLLNTPWYIKQLRNNEPKVKIGRLSDATIDDLTVIPWKKKQVKISPPPGSDLPPMEWELKPTIMGQGLRVQDIMILQILEANKWERPVYFATTVSPSNRLNMEPYLQMEGLTFRIHPQKVKRTDIDKIENNLLNVYRFRNLNNPKVYFNDTITKLIGNYRAAFFQVAVDRFYSGEKDKMLAILDSMEVVMPESLLPIGNVETYLQLGMLYHEGGRSDELRKRLDALMSRPRLSVKEKVKFASIYYQYLNDYEKALSLLEPLYEQNPGDPEIISILVRLYEDKDDYANAARVLDSWLLSHPGDKGAQSMRDEYLLKIPKISPDSLKESVPID
jgi:MFS family permease